MFSPSWYFIVTLKYLFYTIFTGLLIWVFKLILFLPWFEGIRCLFLLSLSWNETKNLFAFGVSQQLSMCVIVNPISRPPWGGQIYVSSFQSSNRTQFSILRWEISRIYHLVFKVKGGGIIPCYQSNYYDHPVYIALFWGLQLKICNVALSANFLHFYSILVVAFWMTVECWEHWRAQLEDSSWERQ